MPRPRPRQRHTTILLVQILIPIQLSLSYLSSTSPHTTGCSFVPPPTIFAPASISHKHQRHDSSWPARPPSSLSTRVKSPRHAAQHGYKLSSLLMARRTALGASPWKTDDRTVGEWLGFTDRELRRLRAALGPRSKRPGRDLDERLGLVADGKTDSVVGFLRVDFRMSKADTRSMMIRFPRLLVMPREDAVTRCNWLVQNLGLSKKQIGKMVISCPVLFAYGVETSFAPIVMWLKNYLGLNTKEVARLVVRLPQILGLSPTANLGQTVRGNTLTWNQNARHSYNSTWCCERRMKDGYIARSFLESLELNRRQVAKMVLTHPEIFSYSIGNKIIPLLDWLQTQLRATPTEVVYMVTKYPSLMGCSTAKNLAPKFSFLREILGASIEDIRVAVVSCPSLLGYSLDRRIRPRVNVMLERQIYPRFSEHKWLLTVLPDESFEEWVRENAGGYRMR